MHAELWGERGDEPHVGPPVAAEVASVIDVDRGKTGGERVLPVAGEPHAGPLLPLGHRPRAPRGVGDRFGHLRAAAEVDADPWIKRLPVVTGPGHVAFDRGDRVAVLEARTDRRDQVGELSVTG